MLPYVVDCTEKAQLIEDHHLAAIAYSQAARALNSRMRILPPAEGSKLRKVADEARIKAVEARTALKLHQIEHGC
jgi:uncharacterized protein (DUF2342 family)